MKNIFVLCLSLIGFCLSSCTGSTEEPLIQSEFKEKEIKPKGYAVADLGQEYIPATVIPSSASEQEQLLKRLSANQDVSFNTQRLKLFVRYAQLVNSRSPKQNILKILISDISNLATQHKDDHELAALMGSATSFQAVFYPEDSGTQQLLAKKGGRMMDRAIRNAPNHLGVRLQRGITYATMPAFLGKARYSIEDLLLIKAGNVQDDSFTSMVGFYLGMALIKDKQVVQGLKVLAEVKAGKYSPWSQKSSDLIDENS